MNAGNPFDIAGRVAIITGASTGLGEQFARAMHAAGAHVVLAARRIELVEEVVAHLGGGLAVRCDVTDAGDRAALVESALRAHGHIDVLVNNAGTAQAQPAIDESIDGLRAVMETNLNAVFALCQLAAPSMIERGAGSIVNIASLSYARSVDRYALAAYAASKGAVVALTRELAAQWGSDGVRVNAIAPAFFPSNLSGWLRDPEQVEWISGHTALGRPGRREELDGTLLYLASDASSYVTGQTIVVDGGWTVY
jgi:NAD(P)-dependent dehydrogenase (short-subunit alcohol dehydrogenase family)